MELINAKVEANLIYRLLVDPSLIDEVKDLNPNDFGVADHKNLFAEIMMRRDKKEPIDALVIEEATGISVDPLRMAAGATAPVSEYVGLVRDLAVRRELVGALEQARTKIFAGEDALDVATRAVDRIASSGAGRLASSTTAVGNYRTEYARRSVGDKITFGIPGLDSLLMPMRPGKLVIFAARPGVGKTAIAETIGDHVAVKHPVLFVSLEMMAEDLIDRGLARESGHAAKGIIEGSVDITELEPHLMARGDLNITYMDNGKCAVGDVQRAINQVRLHNDGEIGLVIVDYLQLMEGEPQGDEFQRVSNISHGLKRLALANKVPVLALAQLNRQLELDGGRTPRLSDLAKSDSIGQDADVVVVINGRPADPMREFHVIKQRQGASGRVDVLFDGSTQRWGSPLGEF